MLTHENLIEMTEQLDDEVKKKEVYIAIPSKNGFMLHEVVGAELVNVDGDMDGEFGVLVGTPVASYHLDGGAQQADHDPESVPVIRYEYILPENLQTILPDTEDEAPCEETIAHPSQHEKMPTEETDIDE